MEPKPVRKPIVRRYADGIKFEKSGRGIRYSKGFVRKEKQLSTWLHLSLDVKPSVKVTFQFWRLYAWAELL